MSSIANVLPRADPDNQFVKDESLVHQLPDEILSDIFFLAMYSLDITHPSQFPSLYTTRTIYRRLYNFLGVCTWWRRVILSSGSLWTLIPLIEPSSGGWVPRTTQLSLERAAGHRLRLVAHFSNPQDFIFGILSRHASQFDAINIRSNSADSICNLLAPLIKNAESGSASIKELSLCHSESLGDEISRPPAGVGQHVNFHASPPLPLGVNGLIESLYALRISGMNVNFEGLSLKTLTNIRLDSLVLGPKLSLVKFTEALASATQLRTLELISVLTIHSGWENISIGDVSISLPNLEHLYLDDLNLDTLKFILATISSGSHTTTLNWTHRCCETAADGSYTSTNIVFLRKLSRFNIDVLLFRRQPGEISFHKYIYYVLQAMPSVTTLCLDLVYLNYEVLDALVPVTRNITEKGLHTSAEDYKKQNDDPPGFAQLTNLYICRSHCHDLDALRDLPQVLASHRIQELGIGIGPECDCKEHHARAYPNRPPSSREGRAYRSLVYRSPPPEFQSPPTYDQETIDSEMKHIWDALENSIPRLVRFPGNSSDMPPVFGFASHIWQL
ncbi:unnamed protein product [Rhizoctonia solani]|uniref:F-box domain-containing protein n=1 Tax=Rhizoctonia solani TaxID=456999 RepID=A0A8H3E2L0_9AGAM|nr:unnamed protein product [Rhizoctonia solani]